VAIEFHHILAADVVGEDNHSGEGAGGSKGTHLLDVCQQVSAAVLQLVARQANLLEFSEALHDGEGEEEEYRKASQPVRDRRVGRRSTRKYADGVEAGEDEHIEEWNALQVKRVGKGAQHVEHKPGQEVEWERARDSYSDDQQGCRCNEANCGREIAGGKGPRAFASIASIGLDVEKVVDKICCGSGTAEAKECEERMTVYRRSAVMCEKRWKENEKVLCPLVRPQGSDK